MEAEGDKNLKAAKKLTSASILSLRLKSNWEEAGPLYEKAANNFKQAKAWHKSREAYEMAAKCAERQGSPWHAAKHLERAGDVAKETSDWPLMLDYFKRASLAYREAGRAQSAAEILTKGAKILEATDMQAAAELLAEAVDEIEVEGNVALAGDIYRQAVEAVGMLLRFAAACDASNARASQCKAYLGAVVVWLHAQDGRQAWAVYQDALEVEVFAHSDEAFAAEALLDAYRNGDASQVQKVVASKAIFRDLDNMIARLAKKLPGDDLGKVSSALGGQQVPTVSANDIDEEDLT